MDGWCSFYLPLNDGDVYLCCLQAEKLFENAPFAPGVGHNKGNFMNTAYIQGEFTMISLIFIITS